MTLPANIRVNLAVPFPAMVQGSGPIAVTKVNGVWTLGFSIVPFGSQNPPVGNFPTDFLLGFDTVNNVFFKISLTNLLAALAPPSPIRTQRLATSSPITVSGSDNIINVNISSGSPTCTLPLASSRAGSPLTFKDVGGNFAAHNLTIAPAGGDNIDGGGAIVLGTNRQSVTLVPANDGITVGWAIE